MVELDRFQRDFKGCRRGFGGRGRVGIFGGGKKGIVGDCRG